MYSGFSENCTVENDKGEFIPIKSLKAGTCVKCDDGTYSKVKVINSLPCISGIPMVNINNLLIAPDNVVKIDNLEVVAKKYNNGVNYRPDCKTLYTFRLDEPKYVLVSGIACYIS